MTDGQVCEVCPAVLVWDSGGPSQLTSCITGATNNGCCDLPWIYIGSQLINNSSLYKEEKKFHCTACIKFYESTCENFMQALEKENTGGYKSIKGFS